MTATKRTWLHLFPHVLVSTCFLFTALRYTHRIAELEKELSAANEKRGHGVAYDEGSLPARSSADRGFHPVYVYGGGGDGGEEDRRDDEAPESEGRRYERYSQANQDRTVMALSDALDRKKRPPPPSEKYFVDLASNDARLLSNTLRLEETSAWTGLCVEGNPVYWYRLATLRTCTVVGAMVGGETDGREVRVNFEGLEFGGIAGEGTDNEKGGSKRETVSVETLFRTANVPDVVDYLSLDVEGAESLVMEHFPWGRYRIRILTVERPKEDLVAKLLENGYRRIQRMTTWGEELWMHGEEAASLSDEEIMGVIDKVCDEHSHVGMVPKEKRYFFTDGTVAADSKK